MEGVWGIGCCIYVGLANDDVKYKQRNLVP